MTGFNNGFDDIEALRNELRASAAIGGLVLLAGFCGVGWLADWRHAWLWLFAAAMLWAYVWRTARLLLSLNRPQPQTALYPSLGWGNRVTLGRGGLIARAGGFLATDLAADFNVWAAAFCYSLAAVLDRCDGFLARRGQHESLLGSELDIRCDALGLVIAPLLAIAEGRLHPAYLLLSMAFYGYRWGLQRRQRRGLTHFSPPDNPLKRTLAGFQMGFIAAVLWPVLSADFTRTAGIAFMWPVLFGFIADWLVVCGVLSRDNYDHLAAVAEHYILPGLRLVVALVAAAGLPQLADTTLQIGIGGVLAVMVLFGLAGRLAALGMLLWLGAENIPIADSLPGTLWLFAASALLLLGTGRASLWHCGDAWLQRYDGA